MPVSTERRILMVVVIAGLLALGYTVGRDALRGGAFLEERVYNWNVWYCGAEAVAAHRDPYRVEPLRSCEHRVRGPAFNERWAVVPMPLPGYSLALLWPLLALPFYAGKAAWIAMVLAALGSSAWCSARLTGLWFPAVLLVFAPSLALLNLLYGGLEPVAVAALCAAALALERSRPALAGALSVVAMLEPHVGLPAVVAVFLLVPRARVAAAATVAVFAVATVALLGWPTVVEYVRDVLPAQSAGEAAISWQQYSLTHVLYLAGVPVKVATTLGSLWYLAAIALGIFAAARLRALYGRSAPIVLVPAAISLFGGLYVHNHQISAALPAALLLASLPIRGYRLAVVAAALLAFPWEFVTRSEEVVAAFAVCASVMLLLRDHTPWRRLADGAVVGAAFVIAWSLTNAMPHSTFALAANPASIRPEDFTTVAWTKFLLWTPGRAVDDAATLFSKAPWWLALFALTVAATFGARRRSGEDRLPASPP